MSEKCRRALEYQRALDYQAYLDAERARLREQRLDERRSVELCRQIWHQFRTNQRNQQRQRLEEEIGRDVVDLLIQLACLTGNYLSGTSRKTIPYRLAREWKQQFVAGLPFFPSQPTSNPSPSSSSDQTGKEEHDEDKVDDHQAECDQKRQQLLDDKAVEDYEKLLGEWKLTSTVSLQEQDDDSVNKSHQLKTEWDRTKSSLQEIASKHGMSNFLANIDSLLEDVGYAGYDKIVEHLAHSTQPRYESSVDDRPKPNLSHILMKTIVIGKPLSGKTSLAKALEAFERCFVLDPIQLANDAQQAYLTSLHPDESVEDARTAQVDSNQDVDLKLLELGKCIDSQLKYQAHLSDQLLVDLLLESAESLPPGESFLVDNFPSTIEQAHLLTRNFLGRSNCHDNQHQDDQLSSQHYETLRSDNPGALKPVNPFDLIICLDISDDEVWRRAARLMKGKSDEEREVYFATIRSRLIDFDQNWSGLESLLTTNPSALHKLDAGSSECITMDEELLVEEEEEAMIEKQIQQLVEGVEQVWDEVEARRKQEWDNEGSTDSKQMKMMDKSVECLILVDPGFLDQSNDSGDINQSQPPISQSDTFEVDAINKDHQASDQTHVKGYQSSQSNNKIVTDQQPRDECLAASSINCQIASTKPICYDNAITTEFQLNKCHLAQSTASQLLEFWTNSITFYKDSLKATLGQRRSVISDVLDSHLPRVEKQFYSFLQRPNDPAGQKLIEKFKELFNRMPTDLRSDPQGKAELHYHLTSNLKRKLLDQADARQRANQHQADETIAASNWLSDQCVDLTNHYVRLMQAELNRLNKLVNFAQAYFRSLSLDEEQSSDETTSLPELDKNRNIQLPLVKFPDQPIDIHKLLHLEARQPTLPVNTNNDSPASDSNDQTAFDAVKVGEKHSSLFETPSSEGPSLALGASLTDIEAIIFKDRLPSNKKNRRKENSKSTKNASTGKTVDQSSSRHRQRRPTPTKSKRGIKSDQLHYASPKLIGVSDHQPVDIVKEEATYITNVYLCCLKLILDMRSLTKEIEWALDTERSRFEEQEEKNQTEVSRVSSATTTATTDKRQRMRRKLNQKSPSQSSQVNDEQVRLKKKKKLKLEFKQCVNKEQMKFIELIVCEALFRLTLIHLVSSRTLDDVKQKIGQTWQLIQSWIDNDYRSRRDAINSLVNTIGAAIESESPLTKELVLDGDQFYILKDKGVDKFDNNQEESIIDEQPNQTIPDEPSYFTCDQLEYLINKFHQTVPNGWIEQNEFVTLIQPSVEARLAQLNCAPLDQDSMKQIFDRLVTTFSPCNFAYGDGKISQPIRDHLTTLKLYVDWRKFILCSLTPEMSNQLKQLVNVELVKQTLATALSDLDHNFGQLKTVFRQNIDLQWFNQLMDLSSDSCSTTAWSPSLNWTRGVHFLLQLLLFQSKSPLDGVIGCICSLLDRKKEELINEGLSDSKFGDLSRLIRSDAQLSIQLVERFLQIGLYLVPSKRNEGKDGHRKGNKHNRSNITPDQPSVLEEASRKIHRILCHACPESMKSDTASSITDNCIRYQSIIGHSKLLPLWSLALHAFTKSVMPEPWPTLFHLQSINPESNQFEFSLTFH